MKPQNDLPPKPRDKNFYATKLLRVFVCGSLVKSSRLVEVMLRSRNIIQPIMWASYFFYAVFFAMWIYTAFLVQPRHPNWNETHKHLLYGAIGVVTAAGFLWIIAVWPVYHVWTIPLGVVVMVMFLDLVVLFPSRSRKAKP
ncbi:hypothetical protein DQ04_08841030 [Trypanosoma grayi]|uniref:hypothetical protein n=1 Tax=Trypanosoma grayi TaxID=71804 RepID=UPI0004F40697|nr:hypothetical protein DQ04_08841030 [Trypanosoma grayi]KEG07783.1 hypothetical protein DQ04_08841030 [Trypanosoma grayi]